MSHNEPSLSVVYAEYERLLTKSADALRQLEQWAENGSAHSAILLGRAFEIGQGVAVNFLTAEQWFKRAACIDESRGYFNLGCLYLERRRFSEAKNALEISASTGYAPASHRLGRMYFYGFGVDKDLAMAKMCFEKATAAGNIGAKLQLAHVLKTGRFGLANYLLGFYLSIAGFIEGMHVHVDDFLSERLL